MSIYQKALSSAKVRSALDARGAGYLARVKAQAIASGRPNLAAKVRVERGVRPGTKAKYGLKRPYFRVVAYLTDEERMADNRMAKATPRQIFRMANRG